MMIYILRRIPFLLLFFSIAINLYAGPEAAEIDNIIKRGLENCYHFRWKSAEQDFDLIIKKYPDDPRGYHYKSGIYLWYYLSSKDEKDLENFLRLSDIAIAKGDKILDRDPDNLKINYTLGNAYSYRTLGYAKSESYLNAIWASKKSEKILKKIIESDSKNYDAYLGLGLYNFAAAQIPSAFKWALNLAGISGDEDRGIRFIEITAEKGDLSKIEAKYYLSQLLTGVLLDYERAGQLLTSLNTQYPSNILFSYGLAVVHLKEKNPEKAEKILLNIIRHRETKFRQVVAFSNFLLGDVYFRQNEYEKAISYYKSFLKSTGEKDYKGIASYRIALCYEFTGNKKSSAEYFRLTSSGNPDIEDDIFASRRGSEFLKKSVTGDHLRLISLSNQVESGKFKSAIDGLNEIIGSTGENNIKAEAYYWISEAAFLSGLYKESLNFALKGSAIQASDDGWINALCFYNAARAEKQLGNNPSKYIESAEENNNSDYQKQISNMLKSLKRQQ
jgi:tetratricopeptide (TPR) repeat protein